MFDITSHYNSYLGADQETLRLVVSLDLSEQVQLPSPRIALAIVLDCSGSMSGPKIKAARNGAVKVVQELNEQFSFVVIAFANSARVIYGPARGIHEQKQQAIKAIMNLGADGGTSMSSALQTVLSTLSPYRDWARNVLFLTDGQNGDRQEIFLQTIEQCAREHVSIYAWGVGSDWNADELRAMAERTHGNADIIPQPQQIEESFRRTFQQIRQTALTNVHLLLWTPGEITVQRVQQAYPSLVDLDIQPDTTNPRQRAIPLGSFAGGEKRDFLITLGVHPHDPGKQHVVMRPGVRFMGSPPTETEERGPRESWVVVEWTLQTMLAAQIDKQVAHYTQEGQLADLINQGDEALEKGDELEAARLLGQALKISEEIGNQEMAGLLRQTVALDANGRPILTDTSQMARKTRQIKKGKTTQIG